MYFWHICSGHDTLFPLQEGAEANIQEETRKRALGRHAVFFLIDIVLMNWFDSLLSNEREVPISTLSSP